MNTNSHLVSRTTVRSCSHSALSVNKWKKSNWRYFFEFMVKSNALLYKLLEKSNIIM